MSLSPALEKKLLVVAAVVLWLPLTAFGISVLWRYSTTPGRAADPPAKWPSGAPISRASGRSTLLLFAHPECECSAASLSELGILLAHAGGSLEADVFFTLPASQAGAWRKSKLFSQARAISGVQVFEDPESRVAQQFGAYTSGQTLLYDASGRLLFDGGITAFRGHAGDNAGRSVISALLQQKIPRTEKLPVVTPVFGCSLRGE
jgi:hypothetical protein